VPAGRVEAISPCDCVARPAEEGFAKINNSQFNQEEYDANPDKPKKRAIALFAMQIRTDRVMHSIPGCELFTVTDLWDRNSTDGLVKVRFYFDYHPSICLMPNH